MLLTSIVYDLCGLFYPRVCAGCNETLLKNEEWLCTSCLYKLPRTNFHNDTTNEVSQMFWGRARIEYAAAFLCFQKKGIVQAILHKIKYKGEKELGVFMGKLYGFELRDSVFTGIDVIIPVPLHWKKYKERGYNQSEMLAQGLSEAMGIPIDTQSLKRKIANPTQTRRHRYERWLNVNEIFEVVYPANIENKHVLLVDDVVTTGATLESCANVLLDCNNTRVSIVTLAKA